MRRDVITSTRVKYIETVIVEARVVGYGKCAQLKSSVNGISNIVHTLNRWHIVIAVNGCESTVCPATHNVDNNRMFHEDGGIVNELDPDLDIVVTEVAKCKIVS